MLPFGPPYHTVVGNTITIYLNIVGDTDGTLGLPIDNALAQLAVEWIPIATANNLTVTFALGSSTPAPMVIPAGINNIASVPPTSPGVYFIIGATPPSGVRSFNFTIGRGKNAAKGSRSARISYVSYKQGNGYIYQLPQPTVPLIGQDISHELGHVLGLSDRYYEAVFWLRDYAINMTCKQIRQGGWVDQNDIDLRMGIQDNASANSGLPRLAVRASLPIQIPGEPSINNLMSNGSSSLTATQVATILARTEEQQYRDKNWIAILGSWRTYAESRTDPAWVPGEAPLAGGWLATRATDLATGVLPLFPNSAGIDPSQWRYPTWEATTQDKGTGLVFRLPNIPALHRYGCLRFLHKGKNANKDVIHSTRLAEAMGKKWVVGLHGKQKSPTVFHPHWMCHVRRMIYDLMQP